MLRISAAQTTATVIPGARDLDNVGSGENQAQDPFTPSSDLLTIASSDEEMMAARCRAATGETGSISGDCTGVQ